ncbi:FCD domain-containing protein [Paracoccus marcusii]|uniref:FadR/GntR family transcriptional regulator n=1 Tax=Paracoccus marcusii TaxID=59779 RepID=UPI002ED32ECC|nr:FCD domain-containing protein [Paracoccus marcusii]
MYYFKERILRGELKVGDQVMPERELAQHLDVGRPLLREVMKSLAMLGFLNVRQGSGTYIAKADIRVLSDFFTFCLSQEQDVLEDVMQARMAIECQAIRLACERANEADLARIGRWLGTLIDTLTDPEAGGRADFMFHQSIVAASHSRALTTLYGAMAELCSGAMSSAVSPPIGTLRSSGFLSMRIARCSCRSWPKTRIRPTAACANILPSGTSCAAAA